MAFDPTLIDVFDVPPDGGTFEERDQAFVDRYFKSQMSPENMAALRYDAKKLGAEHVFISRELRKIHLGPMDGEAFKEFVGHAPRQDDLHRVNCLEAGVGHLMCGWCDRHERPRFACGCAAR